MTTNQKDAARLRGIAATNVGVRNREALLAGAEALEGRGRWRLKTYRYRLYFVPVEHEIAWREFLNDSEPGEYTAILPEWAKPVPENVVITGWELP
jgi:hypothetical protein